MENHRLKILEPPAKRPALINFDRPASFEPEAGENDNKVPTEKMEGVREEVNNVVDASVYYSYCANEMFDNRGMNRRRLIQEEEQFPDEAVSMKLFALLFY